MALGKSGWAGCEILSELKDWSNDGVGVEDCVVPEVTVVVVVVSKGLYEFDSFEEACFVFAWSN